MKSVVLTSDEEDTLATLSQVRTQLHNQLSKIEFADQNHDTAVNSIALIIRTLDKVDQVAKALRRDELLEGEIFYSLKEAQIIIEQWRIHYNTKRPLSSLGHKPPAPETIIHLHERIRIN